MPLVVQLDDHVHVYADEDAEMAATVAAVGDVAAVEAGAYRVTDDKWEETRTKLIAAGGTIHDHRKGE